MKRKEIVTLEEYVKRKIATRRDRLKAIAEVYQEMVERKIEIVDPNPPKAFIEYLVRLDHSIWFWITVCLPIFASVSIIFSNNMPGMLYLRYILGIVYVLFLPGYVTIEALYHNKKELSPLEKLTISIGISLAITSLVGLALNYTPWGISPNQFVMAMTFYVIAMAFLASRRMY